MDSRTQHHQTQQDYPIRVSLSLRRVALLIQKGPAASRVIRSSSSSAFRPAQANAAARSPMALKRSKSLSAQTLIINVVASITWSHFSRPSFASANTFQAARLEGLLAGCFESVGGGSSGRLALPPSALPPFDEVPSRGQGFPVVATVAVARDGNQFPVLSDSYLLENVDVRHKVLPMQTV